MKFKCTYVNDNYIYNYCNNLTVWFTRDTSKIPCLIRWCRLWIRRDYTDLCKLAVFRFYLFASFQKIAVSSECDACKARLIIVLVHNPVADWSKSTAFSPPTTYCKGSSLGELTEWAKKISLPICKPGRI